VEVLCASFLSIERFELLWIFCCVFLIAVPFGATHQGVISLKTRTHAAHSLDLEVCHNEGSRKESDLWVDHTIDQDNEQLFFAHV